MKPLKFLLLEDSLLDAELIQAHLEEGNIDCELVRVETRADFENALLNTSFDLILADYSLPSFDGITALKLAHSYCPETPFIFVSATLGEEVAIETLKSGATDYVLKQRLGRLAPSVKRSIRECKERQERQDAEEKLYRREQEFKTLVENSPDIIARFDKQLRHVYVNPAIEQITGHLPEAFIGKTHFDLGMPKEKCLFWQGILAEVFATGESQTIEFDFLCPKGIRHEYHSRLVPEFGPDGSVEFVFSVAREITDVKEAQAALRESELRYATLTETVPIIIFTCDSQGINDYCNQRWYDYSGLTTEETKALSWLDTVHPEDAEKCWATWNGALKSGTLYEIECRLRSKEGTYSWFWVRALPLKNSRGQVSKWFGTCTNIDEHKRVEEEREALYLREQAAREEAEAASRMKDEFLATLSHELRTPLNAMLGWTQLLLTKEFKPETRDRALETIHRNTKSLAQLIEDVLDVSRIIRGKLHLNVHPIELAPVIEAAVETIQPAATAKNITVTMSMPQSSGNLVLGDYNRLQQVVWNLLSNAVKFTPKGGRVSVSLDIIDSSLAIRVIDTGQGIAPEFLPYVFERFRQADSSITRSFGGLGLGLAIVRHLVELHGGTVSAESPGVGQGATFTVKLPLRAVCDISPTQVFPTSRESRREDSLESSLTLEGLNILVVDDEADARELISMILEDKGARVKAVGSVSEALKVVKEGFANILISDIGMPQEDGYSLITQVRALDATQGGDIPAIALTAYARPEDRRQALAAGYQLHIAKPVDPAQLTEVVAHLDQNQYQMVK